MCLSHNIKNLAEFDSIDLNCSVQHRRPVEGTLSRPLRTVMLLLQSGVVCFRSEVIKRLGVISGFVPIHGLHPLKCVSSHFKRHFDKGKMGQYSFRIISWLRRQHLTALQLAHSKRFLQLLLNICNILDI